MKETIILPSNKQFGFVFFIFFSILGAYFHIGPSLYIFSIVSFVIGLFFLILGVLNSKILYPLNLIWTKFGLFLGKIISPIIMGVIFFFIVTPIGIFMRCFQKNFLNLKFEDCESYWLIKKEPESKMKNQF